ncbi:MAG: MATE family efflux transporter [Muribaculaceae bacterium]|nr:MATE family efflux transporter [Muribaculaceae bacterium]
MKDNKEATLALGTQPVGRLLWQYALPGVIAMTASSLYNMVDSIFIGHGVGSMALAALGITFPFMNIGAAFGAAVGVGGSTLMSLRLGQRQYTKAQHVLGNMVALNIIMGLLVGIVSILFLDPILRFFGASDQTLPLAHEYMFILLLGNVITHLYLGLNAALRSASKPRQAMIATIVTVVLNIILDPIFIWPLHMGIKGAAIATVIAQAVVLCWQLWIFSRKRELLHLEWRFLKPVWNIVKDIVGIGISPFAMQITGCVVAIFTNNLLMANGGDLAVGAYGIAHRLGFVFFMVIMGICQGMQPIAGYNYGARNMDRVKRVVRLAIIASVASMTVGWFIGEVFTRACVRMFSDDNALIAIAVRGIRINMLVFPIIGYQATVTNFFQTIGKVRISIFMSLSRQLLFLLPMMLVFAAMWGLDGVWFSLPASDLLSFLVAVVIMQRFKRQHSSQTTKTTN